MKINTLYIGFITLSILIILVSSCKKDAIISIHNDITNNHVHLGTGVYIIPPKYFIKKSSPGLYQFKNEASISFDLGFQPISKYLSAFDKKYLSRRNSKLLQFSKVLIPEADSAFYTKVLDKRKGTIRQAILISKNDSTFIIKAFCFEHQKNKHQKDIYQSLMSLSFGIEKEEKKTFQIAKLEDKIITYTKDGRYPTMSSDSALIEIHQINQSKKDLLSKTGKEAINEQLTRLKINEVCENSGMIFLSDGLIYECVISNQNKHMYIMHVRNDNSNPMFIYCKSLSKDDIGVFKRFLNAELIQYKIK